MNSLTRRISKVAPLSLISLAAVSAHAASLTKVSQSEWQGGVTLPSYVNMYIYVPDKRATTPPILVASHHCQGTGTTTFNETKSTFVSQADKNGYIIIFPEATGHNCWDVGSDKSLKHDGGGDTHAIAQMVRYTITKYSADASRVYAFGGSSGAMMTQALLGIYPDLFMGGVAVSGVPCGCWAEGYTGDTASNGQWSGPCSGGSVKKTAQEWGAQVRAMFPGYTGHRPRVQLWHGDPDKTISFVNFGESIKEWTDLLGLSATPTTTESSGASTTHQIWKNTCGATVLETFAVKGADHSVQWDLNAASSFLGLDKSGGQDPEVAACPGTGGASGVGGAGSGGATTVGTASGGKSATATASGGAPPITVGTSAVGGRSGEKSPTGKGGAIATTGSFVSTSSNVVRGSGGAPTSGGTVTGINGTVATTDAAGDNPDGCSCSVPGKGSVGSSSNLAGFVLGALGVLLRRRRRSVA